MITLTAKIYISETEIIEINRRNVVSIECSVFDRSDLKLPSFGIISNTGNIEFNDSDGRVLQYAENLKLVKGLRCEIMLTNSLVEGASELVGVYETDEWNYDGDSRLVSVSIKDDLEEWQDINVPAIDYDARNNQSKPFSWLYEHLYSITVNNYNMLSFEQLDEPTKTVLQSIHIKYPLLKSASLWQQWNKLCQACQLHIYKDNGIVKCRYNGGN